MGAVERGDALIHQHIVFLFAEIERSQIIDDPHHVSGARHHPAIESHRLWIVAVLIGRCDWTWLE